MWITIIISTCICLGIYLKLSNVPIPRFRTYNETRRATELLERLLKGLDNGTTKIVKVGGYDIKISEGDDIWTFWNENKYYAWLSKCYKNGNDYYYDQLPSRQATVKLYKKIKIFKIDN